VNSGSPQTVGPIGVVGERRQTLQFGVPLVWSK